MKNLSLKKYLIFGSLAICIMTGVLIGCGGKAYRQTGNEFNRQGFSIGEELQWEACFDWQYLPQTGDTEEETTGYFIQEENDRERILALKPVVSKNVSVRQDGEAIEVYHTMLSEEDFFTRVNKCARELAEKYPEKEVAYRINGSAETDQFVQLDAGKEHRLYIRSGDSVYILYGEMDSEEWQDFLEAWLFASGLQWNGSAVMKEGGTVSDTYTGYAREGIRRIFQYGGEWMEIDGEPLLFHRQEDGFYFKLESGDEEKQFVEKVFLRAADIGLKYDSWEEAVSYFEDRYPDMYSLEAYLYGEDTLWDSEKKTMAQVFYKLEEPENSYGFILWNGVPCEISSQGKKDYYNMVETMRNSMGYDYHACFTWEREEDGGIVYEDNLAGKFSYSKDAGNGNRIRFQAEIIEEEESELWDNITYRVAISDEEENALLQEIQAESSYAHKSPFVFEDFNADGYLDLTVIYYYGANGGTASHYIFSPSKEKFVKLDSDLDYYGMYSVDHETRRLYMHYHGSAIDGTEITYQWKNEMDYERIKQYDHDRIEDNVRVKITRYEEGKEEILSDYLYPFEECMERDDIWGTYYEDFIWEKEITDRTTGEKYMIRYAEVFLSEEAEKNNGIYYDGRIYVYDEDTYLISVTHSEIVSESESIVWENGDGGMEQALVIHYVDGGTSMFCLSGLLRPDYGGQQ